MCFFHGLLSICSYLAVWIRLFNETSLHLSRLRSDSFIHQGRRIEWRHRKQSCSKPKLSLTFDYSLATSARSNSSTRTSIDYIFIVGYDVTVWKENDAIRMTSYVLVIVIVVVISGIPAWTSMFPLFFQFGVISVLPNNRRRHCKEDKSYAKWYVSSTLEL